MNRADVEKFLKRISAKGMVMTLEPLLNLCKKLGNPQNNVPCVHIAGTNGKGSVLAMVCSVLENAGYRTGRFFSPKVFDDEPNLAVNGKAVQEEILNGIYEEIIPAFEDMEKNGEETPTLFEVETLASLMCFQREKCDIAVVECGMGGRDDATNIIDFNLVSAITAVGLDHTKFLGNTVTEIAENKSHIIKKGCTAVCLSQEKDVVNIVKKRAEEQGCEFILSGQGEVISDNGFSGQTFLYKGEEYSIPLVGKTQIKNATVAVEICKALDRKGFSLSEETIKSGLEKTKWHGRFEKIHESPLVVIDGAHNVQSAEVFRENVEKYLNERKIFLVMGILEDKQYKDVVKILAPIAEEIFTYNVENPRKLSSEKLAEECLQLSRAKALNTPGEAVISAINTAKECDENCAVCAVGSFYSLNTIRKKFESTF